MKKVNVLPRDQFHLRFAQWRRSVTVCKAIPIKCFVSHRPPFREGGSVGRAKKKKTLEGFRVPAKAWLLSTKAWLRGPFVRNQMV